MKIRFAAKAAEETEDTVDWYEEERAGLGLDFREILRHSLDSIQVAPESFAKRETLPSDLRDPSLQNEEIPVHHRV